MNKAKAIFKRILLVGLVLLLMLLSMGRSSAALTDQTDLIRAYTRSVEFDFVSWTLGALWTKLGQAAVGANAYLSEETRKQIVLDYLELVTQIWEAEYQVNKIYVNPDIADPEAASVAERAELARLFQRRALLGPLAEAIIQEQISRVVADMGLDLAGQPIPPVLYHTTQPPYALIVSPRDHIEQIADINISPDLTLDKLVALEERVDQAQNVSSLTVGIGGIGLYPTMVMETSSIQWLTEVVAHEWIHNYLTWHPLGFNYYTSPALRIINETTASIAGKEIGLAVLERYYPESVPPPSAHPSNQEKQPAQPKTPPAFDFNAEMHQTRVTVDHLLTEGKIEAAEQYMEERRKLFVEQGYGIRKLNQAYFAFYGAYADQPGGAAGEDPVSAAVRGLRAQSASLTDFIRHISSVTSFEQLQEINRQP
jgi:hypothetical protein